VSNIIKPQYQAIFDKKPGLQRFSWTRPVFRTCPKHPAKNEMETSWTGMQNTTCPNPTPAFYGEWALPTPSRYRSKTQNTFGHIFLKTLGKFLKPTSYKIQSFGKNVPPHQKLSKSAFFPDIPLKSTEFGGT